MYKFTENLKIDFRDKNLSFAKLTSLRVAASRRRHCRPYSYERDMHPRSRKSQVKSSRDRLCSVFVFFQLNKYSPM